MTHCVLIALLVGLHLTQEAALLVGLPRVPLSGAFDLVEETSVPNFFSAVALCATSVVAFTAALQYGATNKHLRHGWYLIAALLMFIAFDEGSSIHDRLSLRVQEKFDLHGVFYIGWILPYLFLLAVCLFPLTRVAIALPPQTRTRLIAGAGIYVAAAMGMEALESLLFESSADGGTLRSVNQYVVNAQPTMIMLVTVEEAGEMFGVALALRAMLIHLEHDLGVAAISVERHVVPTPASDLGGRHVSRTS